MREAKASPPRIRKAPGYLIGLAWLAPAAVLVLARARQMLSASEDTAPGVALAAIAAGIWMGLFALPGWRTTLLKAGRLLALRIPFVALLLLALLLWLVASWRGALWLGACLSVTILAAASADFAWRRDRRRFAFSCGLLLCNAILLVGLDAVIGTYLLPKRSHNNIFTEHDAALGWKLRSGLSVRRQEENYTSHETINSMGFRSPEVSREKPPGVRRIVFLGDSHTEGYTVDDGETYAARVGEILGETLALEVISLGVGGFSTDQELLAYLYYGRSYTPDLVVLQFSHNDPPFNVLERYWRGRKPRFERHGDLLVLTGVPVPNLRNTGLFSTELMSRSTFFVYLEAALRQLAIRHDVEEEADPVEAWRVTELLIRDLDRIVESDGARLVVFQADSKPDANLLALLERLDIPFIETHDLYTGDPDSYWVGGHWNQKGQRVIANRLASHLRGYLEPHEMASE